MARAKASRKKAPRPRSSRRSSSSSPAPEVSAELELLEPTNAKPAGPCCLAIFHNAPPRWVEREAELIRA